MNDRLLTEWYELCKFISESVKSIEATLCEENSADEQYTPSRVEVFPLLLDQLDFTWQEKRQLCIKVDKFYSELLALRIREKYICPLDPILQCPTTRPHHVQIVHMFHSLQKLSLIHI